MTATTARIAQKRYLTQSEASNKLGVPEFVLERWREEKIGPSYLSIMEKDVTKIIYSRMIIDGYWVDRPKAVLTDRDTLPRIVNKQEE